MKKEKFAVDPITQEMRSRAKELGIRTVWERYKENHARSKDAPSRINLRAIVKS